MFLLLISKCSGHPPSSKGIIDNLLLGLGTIDLSLPIADTYLNVPPSVKICLVQMSADIVK